MRVIVPYAEVHPDTRAALETWPDVEYRYVGADDYSYGRLLREVWADAEDACIIEHDIVVHSWTLAEFEACSEPYCATPYPWSQAIGVAMGCTRFRSLFMRAYPDVMEIACRIPSNYGEPGHWRQLDVWAQGAVIRDHLGYQPHCHLPPVEHRNPARACPPGTPIRMGVEGRMHLEPGLVQRIADEVAGARV